MPALLVALAVVAWIQPGLAGGQDRDSFQDELEGLREALAALSNVEELWERGERFQLYTGCSPLRLSVGAHGDDAKAIGLTRDRLQAAAESRLRSARLHMGEEEFWSRQVYEKDEPETKLPKATYPPTLSVSAEVAGSAFLVLVELQKTLSDPATGEESKAGTWESGRLGTHGRDAGHIVQLVAEELDKFLVEYLRVNEKDCPR